MKKKVLLCCFLPALILSFAIPVGGTSWFFQTATNSNGESITVWNEQVGCDTEVFGQCYDANGSPVGEKIWVSENEFQFNDHGAVDIDDSGNFVVAWVATNYSRTGIPFNPKPYFRLYDRFANPNRIFPVTGEDQILHCSFPRVAAAPSSGKFIICWVNAQIVKEDPGYKPTNVNIYAQQFQPDGGPMSGLYRVNEESLDCGSSTIFVLEEVTATDEEIAVTYRTRRIDPRSAKTVVSFWADTKPSVTIAYQQGENPGETVFLTISPTTAGKEYQVYYCDKLQENCWLPLGEPVKAFGTQVTVIDDGGISSVPLSQIKSRFYKVSLP